jgi:hypothetical protein
VYLNTPEKGGETHFPNAKAKEGEEGLKIKPRTGMGVIHFPAYMHTSTHNNPAYPNVEMGCKVKHESEYMGEVVSMNADGTVSVEMHDRILGIQEALAADWQALENMHGEPDECATHAGMPVSDEKFLLSQWCWPGPFDFEKHENIAPDTKPLNDGIVL